MPLYTSATDIYGYEGYHLTATSVDTATVNEFIDDAEAVIHGKVSKKYNVPFTATAIPRLIKKISKNLAGYYTLAFLHQQQNKNLSNVIVQKYDQAMDLLDQIHDGGLLLYASLAAGSIGEVTQNVSNTLKATYDNIPPVVDMDDEYNWSVPQSLLDDIEDRRDVVD